MELSEIAKHRPAMTMAMSDMVLNHLDCDDNGDVVSVAGEIAYTQVGSVDINNFSSLSLVMPCRFEWNEKTQKIEDCFFNNDTDDGEDKISGYSVAGVNHPDFQTGIAVDDLADIFGEGAEILQWVKTARNEVYKGVQDNFKNIRRVSW